MPSARLHVLIGSVAVSPIAFGVPDHRVVLPTLAGAMVGSLLPDMDSRYSTLGRYALVHPWRHRGPVHSFFVGGCVSAVVGVGILAWLPVYALWAALSLFVGFGVHLLADRVQGPVPGMWWPFRRSA